MEFVSEADLPLQRVYRWAHARSDEVYLSQPLGGGRVRDYTWGQAIDESRRMAAYLRGRGYAPGIGSAFCQRTARTG